MRALTPSALLLLLLACGDKPGPADDSAADDSAADDSAADDSAADDSAADDTAASELPLDGYGVLSGDCDELDVELTDAAPHLFSNVLDLGEGGWDVEALSEGGRRVWDAGNLGGSSLHSEVLAYEVLYRCELAALEATEAEILYLDPGGKKTDLLVEIDGQRVGVSVTRAYAWPPDAPYTVDQAAALLEDKLGDVLLSSANVAPEHAWTKQVLSVIAYTPDHALAIAEAWAGLDAAVRADTVVYVTATEGDDEDVY